MIIRDLERSDLPELLTIHKRNAEDFPFPDLSRPSYLIQKSVDKNGRLIGAAVIHVTSEVVLILDRSLPKSTRTKACLALEDSLRRTLEICGISECHAFVHDPNIESFLKKIGFEESKSGKALVIQL